MSASNRCQRVERREFLSRLGTYAATCGLVAAAGTEAASKAIGDTAAAAPLLPTVQIGKHQITRLVAGWNPIGGHSYLGHHMNRHMKEYFTVDQTVEFLLDCERAGINTHQFSMSDKTPDILHKVREQGSQMNFFGLHSGRDGVKEIIQNTQPFALAHHGGVTDRLFRENKSQLVHDYVKEVHDQGLLAGVSAHNPECIQRVADEGWEVDFFMCCFYFLTRKSVPTSADKNVSPDTLQIGYSFHRKDPVAMTRVIQEVSQPCLGFKILGAGRLCANQAMVRNAFQFAFTRIKPTDGVIVGMYPRFFDEVHADAEYAREHGKVV